MRFANDIRSAEDLQRVLRRIDGKGYKAYKALKGVYDLGDYLLVIDHVQGDPFASPTKMRILMDIRTCGVPEDIYRGRSRRIAFCDYLTREFSKNALKISRRRGTGNSGLIIMDRPGQEILERSTFVIKDGTIEARFEAGLPAHGRSILGNEAYNMLLKDLPKIVERSMYFRALDKQRVYEHVAVCEDADHIRHKLPELGLVSFIANGSILPRASGIDPRPLDKRVAVPFKSPKSMEIAVETLNHGTILGMGIKKGITLIVGGGYHGKSTLLNAIAMGVYNHIPGDGREFVVTDRNAIKVRAEDGRRVEKVDISGFIANLPMRKDTSAFCTENASGSTSQAANIVEAIEVGATVLLIDEDTSATNFMIRDHKMQELVPKDHEPITPFIDRVRELYENFGVSTILVMGGSGDYLEVADRVICMINYLPHDFTEKAKRIAEHYVGERKREIPTPMEKIVERIPLSDSFDPSRGRKAVKIKARDEHHIVFGNYEIDITALEQIVDINQTRALGDAIYYAVRYMDGRRTMREVIHEVMSDIENRGLDALSSTPNGHYAEFRGIDLAFAINRLRSLRVRQKRS